MTPVRTRKDRPIRIVIAEDHALVRQALRIMFDMEADVSVVGEAGDGHEAIAVTERVKPDVVLMDVRMDGLDGVEATRELGRRCPEVGVLILTGFGEDDVLLRAVEAGAHGFILKDASPGEVVEAIHRVAQGESLVTPALLRRLLDEIAQRAAVAEPPHAQLTSRELEVLKALARGMSNEKIAGELVISEKTVKAHLGRIFSKLQVDGRSQAMLYAIREGLAKA